MNGQFNAAKLFELDGDQEPKYIVLDDIDIDRFFSIKEFFGAQREFDITDKYMKKRTVHWGKPCIWLSNRDPLTTTVHDHAWIRGNTVIYELTHALYDADVRDEPMGEEVMTNSLVQAILEAPSRPLSGWEPTPSSTPLVPLPPPTPVPIPEIRAPTPRRPILNSQAVFLEDITDIHNMFRTHL